MSLYWSDDFYMYWECNTQPVDPITILATPTITGHGEVSTQYLNAAFSAPGAASSPTTSQSGDSGSSGGNGDTSNGNGSNSSNLAAIIGAIAGVVAAIAAVGLWFCTKRHFHITRQHDIQRDQEGGHGRDLAVRTNTGLANLTGEIARPLNVYINELHYHDHTGRGAAQLSQLRLNG
ncbi:uncharacterized protein Z520_09931 [Fonsecaea multimorphosa CBS 102226]|uniref:Mid2 domain-containing protein n=1 Tax=Fonsecaea multimorphosa CBS 102226 TaxID=1442371 RepID=A0A0D2IAN8_9EURO|nr:uncharacterized protein Z520_09931 [Fonsecaea multimorphosa CBS 102226]KIX94221.1 hypothetical protein Z520_09931 [Fonsecaea multimorphosa CBS 102226]OAL19904.1 hypothetical protein AYO22_09431 [Fonsecaea multimorphosa]